MFEDAFGELCGDGSARLGERGAILPQGGVHALELLFPLGNAGLAAAQGFLAFLQFLAVGAVSYTHLPMTAGLPGKNAPGQPLGFRGRLVTGTAAYEGRRL